MMEKINTKPHKILKRFEAPIFLFYSFQVIWMGSFSFTMTNICISTSTNLLFCKLSGESGAQVKLVPIEPRQLAEHTPTP